VSAKGTILIVDDSAEAVELLLRSFKKCGIQNPIKVCTGGAEALKYLLETTEELPVVTLLDLKMPGVDGFHVLSKIKSRPGLRDMIVIVLTTSSDITDIQLSYELGANSFLTKPVDLTEFQEMISAFHKYWVVNNQAIPKQGQWIKKQDDAARV
jgi:CheY-like chemotaxis protein